MLARFRVARYRCGSISLARFAFQARSLKQVELISNIRGLSVGGQPVASGQRHSLTVNDKSRRERSEKKHDAGLYPSRSIGLACGSAAREPPSVQLVHFAGCLFGFGPRSL